MLFMIVLYLLFDYDLCFIASQRSLFLFNFIYLLGKTVSRVSGTTCFTFIEFDSFTPRSCPSQITWFSIEQLHWSI